MSLKSILLPSLYTSKKVVYEALHYLSMHIRRILVHNKECIFGFWIAFIVIGVIGYPLHLNSQNASLLVDFVQNDYAVDPISAALKCICLLQLSTPQSSPEEANSRVESDKPQQVKNILSTESSHKQTGTEECRTYSTATVLHFSTPQINLEDTSCTLGSDKPRSVEERTRTGLEHDVTDDCGTNGAGCSEDSVHILSSKHTSLPFVSQEASVGCVGNVRETVSIPIPECAGLKKAELAIEPPHYSCGKVLTNDLLVGGSCFGRVCTDPTNTDCHRGVIVQDAYTLSYQSSVEDIAPLCTGHNIPSEEPVLKGYPFLSYSKANEKDAGSNTIVVSEANQHQYLGDFDKCIETTPLQNFESTERSDLVEDNESDLSGIHVGELCTDVENDSFPETCTYISVMEDPKVPAFWTLDTHHVIYRGSIRYCNREVVAFEFPWNTVTDSTSDVADDRSTDTTTNGLLVCAPTDCGTEGTNFVRGTLLKSLPLDEILTVPAIEDEDNVTNDLVSEFITYPRPTEESPIDPGYNSPVQSTMGYATVGTNEECSVAANLVLPLCCQEHSICSISPFRPGGRRNLRSESGNKEVAESFSSSFCSIEGPSANLGTREPPVGEEPADENPPIQGHSSLPSNKKAGPSLGPETPKQTPLGTTGTYTSTGPKQIDKTNSAGGTAVVSPVTAATYNSGCRACSHLSSPSYDDHDFAIAHYPNNPEPNQIHKTQLVIGKSCDVVSLLKEMKGRKDVIGSKFSMSNYLELLRLERLSPNLFHSDMALYIMKRVQLEKMYKKCSLSWDSKHINGVVCSFIEQVWGDSEEVARFKQISEDRPKAGWNNLKRSPRIVDMNLDRLSYKLGLTSSPLSTDPYMDNFDAIIDEVCIFLQEGFVSVQLKMGNFVEALYFSGADVLFVDELIFQGKCAY
jgi:hypothetical protein